MRRSEAKFRAVFDHAANGIALMTDDFTFLEANPAMCAMLGRTHQELIGKPIKSFVVHPPKSDRFEAVDELRAIGAWKGTRQLARADGVVVDSEWSVSVHSVPNVWLAVVTDVSERVAAEAERDRLLASERAARSEAERASRLKDEFLATVSHELRSPLNAILGWTQLLQQFGQSDKVSHARGIEAIDRSARVQVKLIGDLLDVSRITSGKLRLEIGPVDIGTVVQNALENVVDARAREGHHDRAEAGCAVADAARRCRKTAAGIHQPLGQRGEVHAGRRAGSSCVSTRRTPTCA
jgi:PAS domain S-box-containing protein